MPELPDETDNSIETVEEKKVVGRPWPKGVSGNPGGRKKLPEEIKAIKEETLEKAITILADIIKDPKFLEKLSPKEQARMMEIAFDRFGLPKVTESKVELTDNSNIADRMKKAQERLEQANK